MKTLNDEQFILDLYKQVPSHKIAYFGRFFPCLKIETLTKSVFFSRSWINSSSKSDPPPDFHNDKHKIMLEVMRIDDCANKVNGKKIDNSFAKSNKMAYKLLGENYKKDINGYLFTIPDTNNSTEFNFKSYLNNFKRVLLKHSNHVQDYHKNYPKCKTTVFLVCDESNNYVEAVNESDLLKENEKNVKLSNFKIHYWYNDSQFIEIIKNSNADFVIWWGYYKSIFINNKMVRCPQACIYDVKHLKEKGYKYNHKLMFKDK